MSNSRLDRWISSVRKETLVDIVKLTQKRGMKGNKGSWKEFLASFDKKFGANLSDPSRRSPELLVAFLKTFSQKDDLKFFDKVIKCHSNRNVEKKSSGESKEQRLVGLTRQHPLYAYNYSFPSYEEEWLITKCSKKSKEQKSTSMVAVDCEMVLCEDGSEALVRICVVDRNLHIKLNEYVTPNRAVIDYRTAITGITAEDLDGVTCSLADIQNRMKKILKYGTILVGHGLNNDLHALKLDHARVIDTSYIFKYKDGPDSALPSLNNLCKAVLGFELRKERAPHNCVDDACAAMKLVSNKLESGVDEVTPIICEMPRKNLAKLLLHGIPINVPSKELHRVIPGNFTIELKINKKPLAEKYSAFAIFKNEQDADETFRSIEGDLDKDSSGLPQKSVLFQIDSSTTVELYVRKMAHDDHVNQIASTKRPLEGAENNVESKKMRTDTKLGGSDEKKENSNVCDSHLREIERLKKELKQRDQEIASLNIIVVALTRKQGL